MKTIRLFRPLALALLALAAALPGAVRAQDTLSETYQFPVTSFYLYGYNALTAPFTQFDPSLGTLTAASVAFEYDFTINQSWGNSGLEDCYFMGPLGINSTSQNTVAMPYFNFYVGGNGGGSNSFVLPVRVNSYASNPASLPPQDLAQLVGNGTYSLVWNAELIQDGAPAGEFAAVLSTSLNPTSFVTVTYTYTPAVVPEPSTWALLGVGVAGLLGLSLQRRTTHCA